MMATITSLFAPHRRLWLFWGYLLFVAGAELVTTVFDPSAGMILHALLLVMLVIHGTLTERGIERHLAIALIPAPLIRLLSLSLPLNQLPQIAWYPATAAPLLVATWVVIRQAGLSRQILGLRVGSWPLQLLLASGGFLIGAFEYLILHPAPLLTTLSWDTLWLPALSLVLFTGFTEELIFRGLLQSVARPVLGRWALVYVSLLFGVLHIGYFSVLDVVFVSLIGLLFAYIASWSGSLLGVTLAHGLANITLFLLVPYIVANPSSLAAAVMPWFILVGSITFAGAMTALIIRTYLPRRIAALPPQKPAQLPEIS
jgi:membrane protease YdiL (CAAX protease family)